MIAHGSERWIFNHKEDNYNIHSKTQGRLFLREQKYNWSHEIETWAKIDMLLEIDSHWNEKISTAMDGCTGFAPQWLQQS